LTFATISLMLLLKFPPISTARRIPIARLLLFLSVIVVSVVTCLPEASAQEAQAAPENAPVDLTADSVEHDETGQTVTARGNVELVQSGRILKADTIAYTLSTDAVRATGNVVLSEPTGDTYFADNVELQGGMKDGFVTGLRTLLADGSRFTAVEGQRTGGRKTVMQDATYTPCEPCKADPSKPPVWQLVAEEVTHDKEDQTISYKNARFELGGVPIAYTPYFSHPDGTVDQKSGFLTPSAGFDSELGATYQQEYYWALAPDKDATIGALVATDVAPLVLGEYRQRFEKAQFSIAGGATYSGRTDSQAGQNREKGDEARGHIFADGLWDINDKWRSGVRVNAATDDQYMRQYDITSEDILENEIYAERFSGRNYAVARAMAYQDLRVSTREVEQPSILPEVKAGFLGAPNETLGGRWSAEVSALGLQRDGNGQDLSRGTVELGWHRRLVTPVGLVTTLDLTGRGDVYCVQDRDVANDASGRSKDASEARGFARAHLQTGYPVAKRLESAQIVIEPLAALTAGTDVDVDSDIPNEDSQDVFIDSLKLFEANRFAGYDRIEDESRVTYGLRTGVYGDNGYRGEVFFGQSRRFEDDDNPFPEGSGLSDQNSDYVGQISAYLGSHLSLDYKFQLENANFSSQRHEVDAQTAIGPLALSSRYFYANGLEGTDLDQSREQISTGASLQLSDHWSVNGGVQYDFGEDEGLRQAYYGVGYTGQCIDVLVTGQRTLTRDSSGDSGTEFLIRVGLKNLGEFQTSGVSLGGGSDE